MDAKTFERTLVSAKKGENIFYYFGFLVADRWDEAKDYVKGKKLPIDELAKAAYKAWEAGKCHLVQKRVRSHRFMYIAVKR